MPLIYAHDLAAWQKWQHNQSRLRQLKRNLMPKPAASPLKLQVSGLNPTILIAVDATTPTAISAFLQPLEFIDKTDVAVLSAVDVSRFLPTDRHWTEKSLESDHLSQDRLLEQALQSIRVVFSGGHYLRAGAVADALAEKLDAKKVVAQHGLLTPFAPPLPSNAHALAFSQADAIFWASGRSDITSEVIGSQLLWSAGQQRLANAAAPITLENENPVFLGQLHGAELARRISAKTAQSFCLQNSADYRPHPAEKDLLSRLQHTAWQRRGISVMTDSLPLRELKRPVVSIFSTGVLEAAAAGLPSWVICSQPPEWVQEFWHRYNMKPWGDEPTSAFEQPPQMPARATAHSLQRLVELGR
jgi:hypothetical protein